MLPLLSLFFFRLYTLSTMKQLVTFLLAFFKVGFYCLRRVACKSGIIFLIIIVITAQRLVVFTLLSTGFKLAQVHTTIAGSNRLKVVSCFTEQCQFKLVFIHTILMPLYQQMWSSNLSVSSI